MLRQPQKGQQLWSEQKSSTAGCLLRFLCAHRSGLIVIRLLHLSIAAHRACGRRREERRVGETACVESVE